MDKEKLRKMYKSLGCCEEEIQKYIKLEEESGQAYFPAIRFIRPLNNTYFLTLGLKDYLFI